MARETVEGAGTEQVDEPTLPPEFADDTDDASEAGTPAAEGASDDDGAASDTDDDEDDSLLSQEELARVQGNAAETIKSYQRAFTQKTQKLAAANKLLKALNADPVGTTIALMERAGIKPQQPAAAQPPQPTAPQQTLLDAVVAELTPQVGEELAKGLAPVMMKTAMAIANAQTQGLQQTVTQGRIQDIQERAQLETENFFTAHPDARQLEPLMMEVAREIAPTNGQTPTQYFKHLYTLAKARSGGGKSSGGNAGEAVRRMVRSASSEPKPGGASETSIHTGPPAGYDKMSRSDKLRASIDAALRGVTWNR